MKKINQIVGLLVITVMGFCVARSQDSFSSLNLSGLSDNGVLELSGTNISSFKTFSDDELTALVGVLDATPTIPMSDLPTNRLGSVIGGTFWSLEQPGMPPLPFDAGGFDLWPMADGSFLLDDIGAGSAGPMGMHAMDDGSPLFPGGGGTNYYTPTNSYVLPDYGTNLWIAQTAITNGYLTGIGSNTLAGVRYVIQSLTNLAQSNWQYEGTIVGSYATNWTPLSVPQLERQNLFIRLASQQSTDGSGIPDWWEEQFGLTNVDPNAQDSAGDGYTIYQKYVLGVNPGTWLTPVAPGDLTVNYLVASAQANVQWEASAGNVVGYQVEKTFEVQGGNYSYVFSTNDFNVSSNALSLEDDVSGEVSDDSFPFAGEDDYFKVRAHYSNGLYSNWSQKTPLKTSNLAASLVYGAGGQACLALTGVPTGTASIRLFYEDYDAFESYGETPINFSNDIPYNLFTNGIYALPDSLQPPTSDSYGPCIQGYEVFAEPVDTNGNATDYAYFYQGLGWDQPFYDGRVQLKQNLIFKLRAADVDKPFRFYYVDSSNSPALLARVFQPADELR